MYGPAAPIQVYESGSWGSQPYYPASNPVDVPDADYLARFSSPVTVTPFYSCGWLLDCWAPGHGGGAAAVRRRRAAAHAL
jgi:hypothetical protein